MPNRSSRADGSAAWWEADKRRAHGISQDHESRRDLDGTLVPKPYVIEAVLEVLRSAPEGPILDPWTTNGLALAAVLEAKPKEKGVAIYRSESARRLSEIALARHNADLRPVLAWPSEADKPYTLLGLSEEDAFACIISIPPWGFRPDGNDIVCAVRRHPLVEVIAEAGSHLLPDGIGVFIIPEAELQRRNGAGFKRLADQGLQVEQILALPPGSFAPITGRGGALVTIRPGRSSTLFCARLTKDSSDNFKIIENALEQKEDRTDASRGRICQTDDFRGIDAIIAHDVFMRTAKAANKVPVRLGSIGTIGASSRGGETFDFNENAIYLPRHGDGAVLHRIDGLRNRVRYVEFVVDGSKARAQWLAGYLSSAIGMQARKSVTTGTLGHLDRHAIIDIPVLLPSLDEQDRAIDAEHSLRSIQSQIATWQAEVWIKKDALSESERFIQHQEVTFTDWLAELPFPLATILWTYHAAGDDARRRYEYLLHFFEAAAAFYATILLSAVNEDERGEEFLIEVNERLKDQGLSFKKATFGTWSTAYAVLAKRLRTLYNDTKDGGRAYVETILKTRDATAINMLLSKRVVSVFGTANTHRNNWTGHGGAVGPEEAERRHRTLRDELVSFRETIGTGWSNYELVLPDDSRYVGGIFATKIERVRGTATPFERADAEVTVPMEDERLHLLGSGEREALLLLPLVRIMASPSSSANACYFYNRQDADEARFISYHFDKEAEVKDIFPDVDAALARITSVEK